MSDQKISVTFRAVDAGILAMISDIQKKSDALTNSAISGARSQTESAKAQLKVIVDQISALERKDRITTQAHRQVISNQRDADLSASRQSFTGRKEGVYNDLRAGKINESGAKERLSALSGSEQENESRIKNNYRENLTAVKEQERQSKLQTILAKENIDTLRATARETVKAIQNGDTSLEKVISSASTDEERLVAGLTKEELATAKRKKEPGGGQNRGFVNSLFAVENINRVLADGTGLINTKNGFDAIPKLAEMGSTALGIVLGGGEASELVGKIFGALGKSAGEFLSSRAIARENFGKSTNRFQAVTGSDKEINFSPDLYKSGLSMEDMVKLQTDIAKRRGYSSGSAQTAETAWYAEKGFGVSQASSDGLIEIGRSAKGMGDLAKLISGIISGSQGGILKDGDRAFADELIGKYTSVTKELLKTAETVHSGTPLDILSRFNSVGGAFSARDPRSGGYINSIQGSLSNPGSDNIRALAFRVLSQQNPNAGIFDLRESMQGGLNSPNYLKGMLSYIDRIGGGDQSKLNNLSGLFPGLPLSAVRRLFNNRSGLMAGNLSVDDLKAKFPLDFQGAAESRTNTLERNETDIKNSSLYGVLDNLKMVGSDIVDAVKTSFSGAVIELKNGRLLLTPTIKQNGVSKPIANDNYKPPASETEGFKEGW